MILLRVLILLIIGRVCSSIYCNDGSNPCELDDPTSSNGYFLPVNGYYCLDSFNDQVICTCPNNSTTRGRPCRICNQSPNPCGSSSSVVTCLDINQSFQCLCNDGKGSLVVQSKACDEIDIRPTTVSPVIESCDNNGVRDPITNQCHCPSGFKGDTCQIQADNELCNNIECMSNGICAIRSILPGGSTYQAKCLCRAGTDGEFCERQNILGTCTPTYCLNNGLCQENPIGKSRYVSCQCKAGYAGSRCEKQYFRCQSSGYFLDQYFRKQGKYFWCIQYNNDYLLRQRSCPKGLQFHQEKQLCLRENLS